MKTARIAKAKLPKVAYFNLSQPVIERPAEFSLFSGGERVALQQLVARLQQARDEDAVKAVLVTLGDTNFNLAQAQEIASALREINARGKRTFVYADAYETDSYTLATGASDVCLLPAGELMMPGVGIEPLFAKGLLDKIGVQADYVQIGEYKGADEQYTRTQASPELKEQLNGLVDAMYGQLVETIANGRKIEPDEVRRLIDQSMIEAAQAKQDKLVDHLVDVDGLRDLIAKAVGAKDRDGIDLVHRYGEEERPDVDAADNPFAFFSLLMKKPEPPTGPTVGIVYADGMIVDGKGGDSLFGGGSIGSEDIRRAMRLAERDENVKSIVIRINSPGGSALASEAMWQAVRRTATTKPVVVSIGSMAASGGYYLASASDTIYADPTAIVGSIGVVGGKFVLKDLFNKVGVSTETITRGRNANLFSSNQPFNEEQRTIITRWMKHTYEQFTQRVMTTRKGKIKDIDKVARGRIFLASTAKELGMVDELGGLDAAIRAAAGKAHLQDDAYEIQTIPGPKSFADLLMGDRETSSPIAPSSWTTNPAAAALLELLPGNARAAVARQLLLLRLSDRRPIMLVAPYVPIGK